MIDQTKWGIGIAAAFILQAGGFIWWAAQKDATIVDMEATVNKLASDNKIMLQVNMERDIKQNAEAIASMAISVKELADLTRELATREPEKVDMGGYVDQIQFDNYMNHVAEQQQNFLKEADLDTIKLQVMNLERDMSGLEVVIADKVDERDLSDLDKKVEQYERSLSGGLKKAEQNIEDLNGITFELEERVSEIDDELGL